MTCATCGGKLATKRADETYQGWAPPPWNEPRMARRWPVLYYGWCPPCMREGSDG